MKNIKSIIRWVFGVLFLIYLCGIYHSAVWHRNSESIGATIINPPKALLRGFEYLMTDCYGDFDYLKPKREVKK